MNDILPPVRPGSQPPRPMQPAPSGPSRPIPPRAPLPKPPQPPVRSQPIEPPKPFSITPPKKSRRKWLIILVATIVVIIACLVASYLWYKNALQPVSGSDTKVKITVQQGSTADQIVGQLAQKRLIKSSLALSIYIKLHGAGNIKAGEYLLAPNQSSVEIMQWLTQGKINTIKVTIVPGETLVQLKQSFIKDGFSAAEVDAAYAKTYSGQLFADKPAGTSLEGYIYPDTYFADPNEGLDKVLQTAFNEFEQQIEKNNLRAQLSAHGFSLYQGITLASIVEKEVVTQSDRRQVAQVFEKRLAEDMPLESDTTYQYASALAGVPTNPSIDSPYNTHLYKGLPPGPIANVGVDTLQAVANPAPGDYLYFVAGDDGVTHFAYTLDEHQKNVENYCKKLCSSTQ